MDWGNFFDTVTNNVGDFFTGKDAVPNILGLAGGIAGPLLAGDSQKSVGYQGGIPEYTAVREQVPYDDAATGRRPGSGGRRYFSDTVYAGSPRSGMDLGQAQDFTQQQAQDIAAGAGPASAPVVAPPTGGQTPAPQAQPSQYQDFLEQLMSYLGQQNAGGAGVRSGGSAATPTPTYDQSGLVLGQGGANRTNMPDTTLSTVTPTKEQWYYTSSGELKKGKPEGELYRVRLPEGHYESYQDRAQAAARANSVWKTNKYAGGGIASLAPQQGRYVRGPTDGMGDHVPATIEGQEPAAIGHGEFIVPADTVSALGNGNSEAGAEELYAMLDRVREARTGSKEQPPAIDPKKMLPV